MVVSLFQIYPAIFTHIYNKEYLVNGSQVKQNAKSSFVQWGSNLSKLIKGSFTKNQVSV